MPQYAYATVPDVEAWTGQTYSNVTAIERLIRRASEVVDAYVTTSFTTDANGLPTDVDYRSALRDAVCAQVALMIAEGASDASDDVGWPRLAASAWTQLHGAGLL